MNITKKIMGQLHLWLGLTSGIVVVTVALTGSLMVFQDELEPILFKQRLTVPNTGQQKLPADQLIAIARQTSPDKKVNQLRYLADPQRSVMITMTPKGKKEEPQKTKKDEKKDDKKPLFALYLNPYTGQVLYQGQYNKQFFAQVRNLHRYLLAGDTGKIITSTSCTIFVFLIISGLILWWPANKNAIKQRFKIKWKASGKRINWDVHAVGGFYISLILLAISLTGLVWSYPFMNNLIFRLADGQLEKKEKLTNPIPPVKTPHAKDLYEKTIQAANALYPFQGNIVITLPAKDSIPLLVIKEDPSIAGGSINQLWFDNQTGALLKNKPYAQFSTGAKIRRLVFPIHTGSIYGWPTKIIALLASLFAAALPITGFCIWLGRKKKTKKKPVPQKKAHPAYV